MNITKDTVLLYTLGAIDDPEQRRQIEEAKLTDPQVKAWFDLLETADEPPDEDAWPSDGALDDLRSLLATSGGGEGGAPAAGRQMDIAGEVQRMVTAALAEFQASQAKLTPAARPNYFGALLQVAPTVAALALLCLFVTGGWAIAQAAAARDFGRQLGQLRSQNLELQSRIADLDRTIEMAGLRTAMVGAISSSGRDSVQVSGSWDRRYVEGAVLRIGEQAYAVEPEPTSDPLRREFQQTVQVPLDGKDFAVALEFQPSAEAAEKLPQFFGPQTRIVQRRFKASRAGLITDPQEINLPAEIDELVNVRDPQEPTLQRNRYIAAGQLYDAVEHMHGWLIVQPLLAENMVVGSRLSVDGSRFLARCYLGDRDIDGQPYRVFCIFHRDADLLKDGQELPPEFDWTGFIKSPTRYKINDGDDGFDREPGAGA